MKKIFALLLSAWAIIFMIGSPVSAAVNLSSVYTPASFCTEPPREAFSWTFETTDIYRLSGFTFDPDDQLDVKAGASTVGIGHCDAGAVWAVVIPDSPGTVTGSELTGDIAAEHIWLRFNPLDVSRLFPPETVSEFSASSPDTDNPNGTLRALHSRIQRIARFKITSSWQTQGRAFLPPPGNFTVDIRTTDPKRFFFAVDINEKSVEAFDVFSDRLLPVVRPLTREEALDQFQTLWNTFDTDYPGFSIRPEIDWNAVKKQFEPEFAEIRDSGSFAALAAEMLKPLKDRHVWIRESGMPVPVYVPDIQIHFNHGSLEAMFRVEGTENGILWGVNSDRIGYIMIQAWQRDGIVDDVDQVLERMRNTRGLIIDVRMNGGGSEPLARDVAGRFVSEPGIYAYNTFKTGSGHDDLSDMQPRQVSPRGPWQYRRPVILLIDEPCLSSNESFICMMTLSDTVTTMGYQTGGSSGNPAFHELPCGIAFSVPQWVDYLPDKTPLEGNGIVPDIPCDFPVDAFSGDTDPVLALAVDRLVKEPLPAEPIAGPAVDIPDRPAVVTVSPPDGVVIPPGNTQLTVQFDRPMNPDTGNLFFQSGGAVPLGAITYHPETYTFSLSARFFPDTEQTVVLKKTGTNGFQDNAGNIAMSFSWSFTVESPGAEDDPGNGTPSLPAVTSTTPAPGATLGWITVFDITFNAPMDSYSVITHNGQGPMAPEGYSVLDAVTYEPESHTFHVPVVMQKNWSGTVTLTGFRDTAGRLCDPVTIPVTTGEEMFSERALNRFLATGNPDLFQALDKRILEKRRLQTAFQIRNRCTLKIGVSVNGYTFLGFNTAGFLVESEKWKAEIMDTFMGFDGEHCWAVHKKADPGEGVFQFKPRENDVLWKMISDPLQLLPETHHHGEPRPHIEYLGLDTGGHHPVHRFRRWMIERSDRQTKVKVLQFSISVETGLMTEMNQGSSIGMMETRTEITELNTDIDDSLFDVTTYTSAQPQTEYPFREPFGPDTVDHFFYLIEDGSRGLNQIRYGFVDDQGRYIGSGASIR